MTRRETVENFETLVFDVETESCAIPIGDDVRRSVRDEFPSAFAPTERAAPKPAEAGPEQKADAPAPAVESKFKSRARLLGAAAVVLAGAGWYGVDYWKVGRFQVSTDDAYVQADVTAIAPKVSGYLATVAAADNEPVRAGQVLARIDDRDLRVALDQAKADVAGARASVANKQAMLDQQQSVIAAARATVAVDEANLTFAAQNSQRYTTLAASGFGSTQNAQQSGAGFAAARSTVERDRASLGAASEQVKLLQAELDGARSSVEHYLAVQHQAELNLSYATIVSPIDGVVGNRTLRVGQYVQAGTQLMDVVPTRATYVVANYKETQLGDVHAGQRVEIAVDMFPGKKIEGRVDSIAPASGQEFALLPPDNATGNFTKVVQRIPVKITLDGDAAQGGMLRPGMSVNPTIETKASTSENGEGRK